MGRPSEQIRCDDWTAGYVLDDATLMFGEWLDNQVKRYAQHAPEGRDGKPGKPPSMEAVIEYERALLEGTTFQRIIPKRRLPVKKKQQDSTVEEGR